MSDPLKSPRGFYGIGAYMPKTEANIGTLLRSAQCFGANFTFVIGPKGQFRQPSNTTKSARHIPHYEWDDFEWFMKCLPQERPVVVGIEEGSDAGLVTFRHPERAVYLLGREDFGLPPEVIERCDRIVTIPSAHCLNVAVAGSIVIYDRIAKAAV